MILQKMFADMNKIQIKDYCDGCFTKNPYWSNVHSWHLLLTTNLIGFYDNSYFNWLLDLIKNLESSNVKNDNALELEKQNNILYSLNEQQNLKIQRLEQENKKIRKITFNNKLI
jgi:hypothetical protein